MRKQPHVVAIAGQLLKLLGVSFTRFYVRHQLEQHPDYLSMMSLVNVLQEMKVATFMYDSKYHNACVTPSGQNFWC